MPEELWRRGNHAPRRSRIERYRPEVFRPLFGLRRAQGRLQRDARGEESHIITIFPIAVSCLRGWCRIRREGRAEMLPIRERRGDEHEEGVLFHIIALFVGDWAELCLELFWKGVVFRESSEVVRGVPLCLSGIC